MSCDILLIFKSSQNNKAFNKFLEGLAYLREKKINDFFLSNQHNELFRIPSFVPERQEKKKKGMDDFWTEMPNIFI